MSTLQAGQQVISTVLLVYLLFLGVINQRLRW